IVDCTMQQLTWREINDMELIKFYQNKINKLSYDKEYYINNLLKCLSKTEITLSNIEEIKNCYELIELHSKQHHSKLFKMHLQSIIEKHQKKHSDYLVRNKIAKAIETENLIYSLEKVF